MPTYINPRRVDVEPRGGNSVAAVIIILAVIGYATWQVADLLTSVITAVFAAVAVAAAASLVTLAVVLRRQHGRTHLDAPQWVTERLGASRRSSAAIADRPAPAISARSTRAIAAPPAIHYHLHVDGVPDGELARVLRRVRPAIEEDQC